MTKRWAVALGSLLALALAGAAALQYLRTACISLSRGIAYSLLEDQILRGWYGAAAVQEIDGSCEKRLVWKPLPFQDVPFDASKLSHHFDKTTYSVAVREQMEPLLFEFFGGGGWLFEGGLVDRVELRAGLLKLYIVRVDKLLNGFRDAYLVRDELVYEVYLVRHEAGAASGRIIGRWTIPYTDTVLSPEQDPDPIVPLAADVEGYLGYDPGLRQATVTVKGLKQGFERKVRVE